MSSEKPSRRTLLDPDVEFVCSKYSFAFRISDRGGYYIVDGNDPVDRRKVLGQGKSPAKAWKHAAENIRAVAKPPKKKRGSHKK